VGAFAYIKGIAQQPLRATTVIIIIMILLAQIIIHNKYNVIRTFVLRSKPENLEEKNLILFV